MLWMKIQGRGVFSGLEVHFWGQNRAFMESSGWPGPTGKDNNSSLAEVTKVTEKDGFLWVAGKQGNTGMMEEWNLGTRNNGQLPFQNSEFRS